MQRLISDAANKSGPKYFVSSAHPRIVDGKPSKNPRYLQIRPDLANPRDAYVAEMGTRLQRRMPLDQPVLTPVNAVMPGRRNNPPDSVAHIRSLAVFNPIHYMELPELFMEFISSMTGKSPSTTGAGSEGAMTKGPFNALPPIIDLNAAFVSYALTGYDVFISAAGYAGPNFRVDHDISLLIPELWCRMSPLERQPKFLIDIGYFEKCVDLEFNGQKVLSSRLGYRMTAAFVRTFFGRVFNHPYAVFTDEMLRPETQDLATFADGMDNIVGTHKRVAESYFNDGSIELACHSVESAPGHHGPRQNTKVPEVDHPLAFRALFTRENRDGRSRGMPNRLASAPTPGHPSLAQSRNLPAKIFRKRKNYSEEAAGVSAFRARLDLAWEFPITKSNRPPTLPPFREPSDSNHFRR